VCAKPGHVVPQGTLEAQRTVDGLTYSASVDTSGLPTKIRAIMKIKNESLATVEIRPTFACHLHVQFRASERPSYDTAIWDSETSPRSWECVGVQHTLAIPGGESRELLLDVPLRNPTPAIPSGAYEIFVQMNGSPVPGWLYAGRIKMSGP
jgi:hypothetical protein